MHLTYLRFSEFWTEAFCLSGLLSHNCSRCPRIMASLMRRRVPLIDNSSTFGIEESRKIRRNSFWKFVKKFTVEERRDMLLEHSVYIYLWYYAFGKKKKKKTDIYSSFFQIKSLRACWIVLQRWTWGRQRGVVSSLSLVPFSFPISAPSWINHLNIPERDFKKEKKRKDRQSRYSEYPKICPIFISSCLVCARACYTPHPSTPTHGKHCFFYFNIFSFLSFRLLLLRLA